MPEAHDILLDAEKIVNDTLRQLFFDSELILLKSSPTTNTFSDVMTISDSWWGEYGGDRQTFNLVIAIDDEVMTDAIAEATHVKVDDDIYVIRNADTLPPKGMDTSWKVFCDRFTASSQFSPLY